MLLFDQYGIEESLQIVVAVVGQTFLLEDSVYIGQRRFQFLSASLVVDDAYALLTVFYDAVQTVYSSADGDGLLV